MTNALEYFMGQSGNSFTSNPVLGAANVITWPKGTGYIGTYSEDYWIETSENLVDWTPVAAAAVTFNSNDIQYTLPSGSPVKFTRLKVVVP
jgi:hypothetical protein